MSKRKKVMLVFGTRPEAIKMAPLVHKFKAEPETFDVQVCVTAQHRQMLDQVLKIFEIVPDIDLDVMKPGQDLFDVTTKVLQGMKDIFRYDKPDIILVHGDTTTTLATAVAGFYEGIAVGHVEAGLRTYDLSAPFPEEFNRQVASKVTRWHFTPTENGRANLIAERVADEFITVTGNTVIDALHWVLNRIDADDERSTRLEESLDLTLPFNWRIDRFVLITGHRRENFGEGFLQICEALCELASRFPKVHFVYPVHLNPNVQNPVRKILGGLSNVHLIEPLGYEPFLWLLKQSHVVLTDSGGIQEEAPSLGKPVLVMRDVTERPEAVEAGTVELVGADKARIVAGVSRLLEDDVHYAKVSRAHNPYGDGKACDRIMDVLRNS
ncbi:UDP-N-acetylglucosamine 2-epimerase (non-hydrolyzing) [Wenzhouxiangella sp. XN24]|uniref:non-hydrolyzing UDP-N-acetylglucosamine 2-epimerase n=1 Tax=Wenzhouxiangella sp. XN24 TaxID=2713569 RepID=UPI0013EC114A|nr:UDP-N-acetylglucosamine 2-epimerase (non-hydrolyzing) [Wenzhouxiangella sp. XN24]NGX17014.1 UDP-N-acetylglucosamine 2-epimerase (non-hydrolyzing) [Wenzhouxiangella sp. XN24]